MALSETTSCVIICCSSHCKRMEAPSLLVLPHRVWTTWLHPPVCAVLSQTLVFSWHRGWNLSQHLANSFPKDPFQLEITGSRRSYLISMHSSKFYICKNVARKISAQKIALCLESKRNSVQTEQSRSYEAVDVCLGTVESWSSPATCGRRKVNSEKQR